MLRSLLPAALVLTLATCAGRTPVPENHPTALPVGAEVQRFYDFVDHLDLADPRYRLMARHGDGTSCYLRLTLPDGRVWGAIVPEHCGTVIDAEIFAHTLATVLGIGGLEGPARRMSLRGPARDRVVGLLSAEDFSGDNHYRRDNVRDLLDHTRAGGPLAAVAKVWGPPPHDVDFLIKDGTLDPAQPLARFLRADEAMPSARPMSFPGVPGAAPEVELARELSSLFVVDMLLGQRDRFSGGNLQVIVTADGRPHFVGYDNGDALDRDDAAASTAYRTMVTRFDRPLIDRLRALHDFLEGRAARFAGYTREADLQRALDLGWPEAWARFRRNLKGLLAHVDGIRGARYFPE